MECDQRVGNVRWSLASYREASRFVPNNFLRWPHVFYPLLGTISVLAACVPSASISALNNWEKTYDN
jgi:hypothetical protein